MFPGSSSRNSSQRVYEILPIHSTQFDFCCFHFVTVLRMNKYIQFAVYIFKHRSACGDNLKMKRKLTIKMVELECEDVVLEQKQ